VGLNPIDWKGPDYNFGLPSLPWINGRDLAGVVVKAHKSLRRIRVGDVILSPSTDYRDIRKAAFQEYVISTEHNSARVPKDLPIQTSAVVGVAFVTAALGLGVCLGLNFSKSNELKGPNLFDMLRLVDPNSFAEDIREECMNGIKSSERAKPGDWIAIWGGM
jgi:NADPH:quinone reductase-like Zn-dependent oxidoreductase